MFSFFKRSSESTYEIIGTARETCENETVYSGSEYKDISDDGNFAVHPGKRWSCLQQLENGELRDIRFLKEK